MRPESAPLDERVAAIATAQGGVVAFVQLLECGLSPSAIARRVRRGWLHRIHHGVYAVGHRRLDAFGRRMAAVLACGEGAATGHRTALAAWALRATTSPTIDVVVHGRGGRRGHAGVRVHRPVSLRDDEITTLDGLPITTPERTIFDSCAILRADGVLRAVEQGEKLRIVDFAVLECYAARPARGVGKLRAALGTAPDRTRSQNERDLLGICTRAGLPAPLVNEPVGPYVVDFLWPQQRLVVEVDSRLHHHTRRAFEGDRRRDAQLSVAGFRVVRITDARLEQEPGAVEAMLVALLRPRRRAGDPGGSRPRAPRRPAGRP